MGIWKWNKSNLKHGAKKTAQSIPAVKVVQAGQQGWNIFQVVRNIGDMTESIKNFIPTMQVMAGSVCDNITFATNFITIAGAAGIGANILLTYQGNQALKLIAARLKDIGDTLEAQTVLMAQDLFPKYVYTMIQEGLRATSGDHNISHWFFVYHPDNVWFPTFNQMVTKKKPGHRFCGYTNQLESLFAFLLGARKAMIETNLKAKDRGEHVRHVKFHILIPAYQPIVIPNYIEFPEDVGDFVIHGKIHKSRELVWINIPDHQERFLDGIGNLKPTPSLWETIRKTFSWNDLPSSKPRILGVNQAQPDTRNNGTDDEEWDDEDDTSVVSKGSLNRDNSHYKAGSLRKPHKRRTTGPPAYEEYEEDPNRESSEKLHRSHKCRAKSQSSRSRHGQTRGRSRMSHH